MAQVQTNPHVDDFMIHDLILKRFAKINAKGRLAHSYLLIGPESIGKSETALEVAKLINCERESVEPLGRPCQECAACRKIHSGNHPDVSVIDKGDGQSIRIASVREMISRIHLRPFEADIKVFLIKNIELMTPEGSNALLKTLEEPSRDSLILLTTSAVEKNLPTIISRCHLVHFFPVTGKSLEDYLQKTGIVDPRSAGFLAAFSEGSLGKAARLGRENFLDRKNEIIDNIVFQDPTEPFLKQVRSDKPRTKELLEVLLSWFRDLVLMQQGVQHTALIHNDRNHDLRACSERFSAEHCGQIISSLIEARRLLNENLNMKIPLLLLREKIWVK